MARPDKHTKAPPSGLTGDTTPPGVLWGDYSDLPSLPPQAVRVFLSSTFTDMTVERNVLMKSVYPKLKEYCRENHGLDFQVVDMRWGVREDASDDHSTTQLCLDEITNCQKVSLGPNFVLMIGQKYGTCTLPASITSKEFNVLLAQVHPDKVSLLLHWYREDTNSIPSEYILQPKSISKEGEWSDVESELRRSLQSSVKICLKNRAINSRDAAKYFTSVTEQEIEKGIFNGVEPSNNCLLFTRQVVDLDFSHPKLWRYIDFNSDNSIDTEAQDRLNDLRENKLPGYLPESNRFDYSVSWNNDTNGGISEATHSEYLDQFSTDFMESMIHLIEKQVARQKQRSTLRHSLNTGLITEVLSHAHTCIAKCEDFVGRDETLALIQKYIDGDSCKPLVVYGSSGVGKTGVMAMAAKRISKRCISRSRASTKKRSMILRFLGTTPETSTIEQLLLSVIKQLWTISGTNQKSLATEFSNLVEEFEAALNDCQQDQCVIFLDSVDQLKSTPQAFGVQWLPKSLPRNIKIVVSSIDSGYNIISNLKHRGISADVHILPLNNMNCVNVIEKWLKQRRRKMTDDQWQFIRAIYLGDREHTPLFLKLICDTIGTLRSYEQLSDYGTSVQMCIDRIFQKLEQKHGKVLVRHALGFLGLSHNGISEIEMEDLLSMDDEVLTDVFQFHIPSVRRLPSILWRRIQNDLREYLVTREADDTKVLAWYHRQFRERCDDYFLNGQRQSWNREATDTMIIVENLENTMRHYFLGVWSDKEKPFKYNSYQMKKLGLDSADSQAMRYVPKQPWIHSYRSKTNPNFMFNKRKMSELSILLNRHQVESGRTKDIIDCNKYLFFDVEYLYSMIKSNRLHDLNQMLSNKRSYTHDVRSNIETRETFLMSRALGADTTFLLEHPDSTTVIVSNQFLPFYNLLPNVTRLIDDCDSRGRRLNALVAPHQHTDTAGGQAYLKVTNHIGPVNDFIFLDKGFFYSISRKLVGVAVIGSGNTVLINKEPRELEKGDEFTMIRTCFDGPDYSDMDSSDDELGQMPHGTNETALYLSTKLTSNVLKYDNTDGTYLGKIDIEQELPSLRNSQLKGFELVSFDMNFSDTLLVVCWYGTGDAVVYMDGKVSGVVHHLHMDEPVVDLLEVSQVMQNKVSDFAPCIGFLREDGSLTYFEHKFKDLDDLNTMKESFTKSQTLELLSNERVVALDKGSLHRGVVVIGTDKHVVHFFTQFSCETATDDMPYLHKTFTVDDDIIAVSITEPTTYTHQIRLILVCLRSKILILQYNSMLPKENLSIISSVDKSYDFATMTNKFFLLAYKGCLVEGYNLQGSKAEKVMSFNAHRRAITKLHESDDFFVTSSEDGSAAMYFSELAVSVGAYVPQFSCSSETIEVIKTSRLKAYTSDGNRSSALWDLDTGRIIWELTYDVAAVAAILTSDGDHVITVHKDGMVRAWDASEHSKEPQRKLTLGENVGEVWLVEYQTWLVIISSAGFVLTVELETFKNPIKTKLKFQIKDISHLGSKLLLKHSCGTVYSILDLGSSKLETLFDQNDRKWRSLQHLGSKINNLLKWNEGFIVHIDQTLWFWNKTSNSVVPILQNCADVTLSESCNYLIASTSKQLILFKNLKSSRIILPKSAESSKFCLTPDDQYILLATPNNDGIHLYRLSNEVLIGSFHFALQISSLATSSDGVFVMAATSDRRLKVLLIADPENPEHDQRPQSLSSHKQPLVQDIHNIFKDHRFKWIDEITSIAMDDEYDE